MRSDIGSNKCYIFKGAGTAYTFVRNPYRLLRVLKKNIFIHVYLNANIYGIKMCAVCK